MMIHPSKTARIYQLTYCMYHTLSTRKTASMEQEIWTSARLGYSPGRLDNESLITHCFVCLSLNVIDAYLPVSYGLLGIMYALFLEHRAFKMEKPL